MEVKKIQSLQLDYRYHQFPNGLRVYFFPSGDSQVHTAAVATNFGGRDHQIKVGDEVLDFPPGFAHFFEHKLFETEQGEDYLNLFTRAGAQANAFTNEEITFYYFSTVLHFTENFDYLLSMFAGFGANEASVEKEKSIITEELMMYENMPHEKIRSSLDQMAFSSRHPLFFDVGGTRESVHSTTLEALQTCYRYQYHPRNLSILVHSSFPWEELLAQIATSVIANVEVEAPLTARQYFPAEFVGQEEEKTITVNIPRPQVACHYAFDVSDYQGNIRREMALEMLFSYVMSSLNPHYHQRLHRQVIGANYFFYTELQPDAFYLRIHNDGAEFTEITATVAEACTLEIDEEWLSLMQKRLKGKLVKSISDPLFLMSNFIEGEYQRFSFDDFDRVLSELQVADFLDVQKSLSKIVPLKLRVLPYATEDK